MVPIKKAYQSCSANWSKERARAYAIDLDDPESLLSHVLIGLLDEESSCGLAGEGIFYIIYIISLLSFP